MAVSINRKREQPAPEVDLTTPHGAQITVSAARAETLLARSAVAFGDGKFRKYVKVGENSEVSLADSKAAPKKEGR